MANGTGVNATGTQNVDALLAGIKWDSPVLKYNFPANVSFYPSDYGGSFPIFTTPSSFETAPQALRDTVAWALQQQFMKVSNLTFGLVLSTSAADISIAGVDIPEFGGFGYYPVIPTGATSAALLQRQGDYWFDSPQSARFETIVRGGSSWRLVMHEIGHTVGLKHGHEIGGVSNTALSADRDSMEFSVMTYRKYVGADPGVDSFSDVETSGAAQTLMMYDIAALQAMYGANYDTNSGNTIYRWSPGTGEMFVDGVGQGAAGANRIFMTLWDGNGVDTYDLSDYETNLQIDLAPGGWSVFDAAQLSKLSLANSIYARGNVFNAMLANGDARSLIENAVGGSGNDLIGGNSANNTLDGGLGNDVLFGAAGDDTLVGAGGVDSATYSGARALYTVAKSGVAVTVSGPEGTDTLIGVERLQFADASIKLGASCRIECNGDGRSDVLWRDSDGTVALWMMDGAQARGEILGLVPLTWKLVEAHGDYDGDGRCDVLWRDSDGSVAIWRMSGSGEVTGSVLAIAPLSSSIVDGHGDYNGDGRCDLLWRRHDGTVATWEMNGGEFTERVLSVVPQSWSIVDGHSDYNGDGRSDVLWRNSDGTVAIWEMNGGQVLGHILGVVQTSWSIVDAQGDYNGDGRSDLLWRSGDGTVATWEMNGSEARGHVLGAVPLSWSIIDGHGDYDGDGKSEVLWRNSDGTVAIWQMNGAEVHGQIVAVVPPAWSIIDANADYNGDGKSDLMWRDANGTVANWQMNGAQLNGQTLGVLSSSWGITDANELGASVNGDVGDDALQGTVGRDQIYGGAGNDVLTGGPGADRFVYDDLNGDVDVITDFTVGAGGDALDMHAVLVGYVQGASNPASFVRLFENGGNTTVSVNTDGADSDFVNMAVLQGVTGVLLKDLAAHGNLVM